MDCITCKVKDSITFGVANDVAKITCMSFFSIGCTMGLVLRIMMRPGRIAAYNYGCLAHFGFGLPITILLVRSPYSRI
jgi:hypothetical protein